VALVELVLCQAVVVVESSLQALQQLAVDQFHLQMAPLLVVAKVHRMLTAQPLVGVELLAVVTTVAVQIYILVDALLRAAQAQVLVVTSQQLTLV
jgi:hypothetical protein